MRNIPTPLYIQRRNKEEKDATIHQTKELENRLVDVERKNFRSSVNATKDDYIRNAMKKVRESKVGLPESLTRHNGSWVYSQSLNKK